MKTLLRNAVLAAGLAGMATQGDAAMHYRGGVFVGPVYRSWGPGWGYGPYWGPAYGPVYVGNSHPNSGQIKFDLKDKSAAVYVDGAYAGLTKDVNGKWFRSGKYDLELRREDGATYHQRVFVTPGNTLRVRPEFIPAA